MPGLCTIPEHLRDEDSDHFIILLHRENVIHADLKPENILIEEGL